MSGPTNDGAATARGATVVVEGLRFRFPGTTEAVLDGLSLRVDAGERVAVLGANGSGKTTFVRHLNGLHELQEGRIEVDGRPMERAHLAEIRRAVGLGFQDPDDQLFMTTVRDDVAFGPANLGLRGDELAARVGEALRAVGAEALADRAPHHLSGGEKRRVALATILAMRPGVLALDEPTSGLDPLGRRELAELLAGLGATQLVVTHDLPFALATCPRSVIVDRGTVVADGPTRDLLADEARLHRHRLELPYGYRLA